MPHPNPWAPACYLSLCSLLCSLLHGLRGVLLQVPLWLSLSSTGATAGPFSGVHTIRASEVLLTSMEWHHSTTLGSRGKRVCELCIGLLEQYRELDTLRKI